MIDRGEGYARKIEAMYERPVCHRANICASVSSSECSRAEICLRRNASGNDDRLREILLGEYLAVVRMEERIASVDGGSAGENEIDRSLRRLVKKHGDESQVIDAIRILLKIDAVRGSVSKAVLSSGAGSHCICPIRGKCFQRRYE